MLKVKITIEYNVTLDEQISDEAFVKMVHEAFEIRDDITVANVEILER